MEEYVKDELQHMFEAFYNKCIDYLIEELAFDNDEAHEIFYEFIRNK